MIQISVTRKIVLFAIFIALINCSSIRRALYQDPFCAKFDPQTSFCTACSCRYYFNQDRVCTQISDFCKTWNINSGECTSCYVSYELKDGACEPISNFQASEHPQPPYTNLNCKTSDSEGKCVECRPYYDLHCGDCLWNGQNPNCSRYDQNDICSECEEGFILDNNNICQQIQEDDIPTPDDGQTDGNSTDGNSTDDNSTDGNSTDGNSTWDNQTSGNQTDGNATQNQTCSNFQNCVDCNQQECTQCEQGYRQQYYSRKCVLPTTDCFEGCALCSPEECFTCAQGYSSQSWPPCQSCSYMYTRNSEGKCKAIQSDCSQFPGCISCVADQCVACPIGYQLSPDYQSCVQTA